MGSSLLGTNARSYKGAAHRSDRRFLCPSGRSVRACSVGRGPLLFSSGRLPPPGPSPGDEEAVEAAEQAVAVDEAVVAVGRPQALGVGGLERREVVVGDLAGLGGLGEVHDRDPAAVPGRDQAVLVRIGLQHVEQVRRAVPGPSVTSSMNCAAPPLVSPARSWRATASSCASTARIIGRSSVLPPATPLPSAGGS